jgi:hypothetical protein
MTTTTHTAQSACVSPDTLDDLAANLAAHGFQRQAARSHTEHSRHTDRHERLIIIYRSVAVVAGGLHTDTIMELLICLARGEQPTGAQFLPPRAPKIDAHGVLSGCGFRWLAARLRYRGYTTRPHPQPGGYCRIYGPGWSLTLERSPQGLQLALIDGDYMTAAADLRAVGVEVAP